jgi:hypothetical protein
MNERVNVDGMSHGGVQAWHREQRGFIDRLSWTGR